MTSLISAAAAAASAAAVASIPLRQHSPIPIPLLLRFLLCSCLTFGTLFSQSTESAATCNNEQANSCRQAVVERKLSQLASGGECLAKQYVHFSHVCSVSNYLPSVDFCCCQFDDRLLCCRYHQDWNHFRCKHDDDVIDNATMHRWLGEELVLPGSIGISCIVVCVCLCYGGRCWCYHYSEDDDDEVWCCGCCQHRCCCCSDDNKSPSSSPPVSRPSLTSVADVTRLRPSSDLHFLCSHRPPSSPAQMAAPSSQASWPAEGARGGGPSGPGGPVGPGVYGCPSCETRPPLPPYAAPTARCDACHTPRYLLHPSTLHPTASSPLQLISGDDLLLLHQQQQQQHPLHPQPPHHRHHPPQPHLCPFSSSSSNGISASRCLFIAYSMQEGVEASGGRCQLHGVPRGASSTHGDPLRPTTLLLHQLYSSCSCSCPTSHPHPHPPPHPLPDDWKSGHVSPNRNCAATAPPLSPHPTNAFQVELIQATGTGRPPVTTPGAAAAAAAEAEDPSIATMQPADANSGPTTSAIDSTNAFASPPNPQSEPGLTVDEEKTTKTLT